MPNSAIRKQYEITWRTKKALKLISSIEEAFPVDYLIGNRKAFAKNLQEMPYAWWRALAISLNENPPSNETIGWVVFYFLSIRQHPWRAKQSLLFKRLSLYLRGIYRIIEKAIRRGFNPWKMG